MPVLQRTQVVHRILDEQRLQMMPLRLVPQEQIVDEVVLQEQIDHEVPGLRRLVLQEQIERDVVDLRQRRCSRAPAPTDLPGQSRGRRSRCDWSLGESLACQMVGLM